jgi:DNA-directed RNA polymerase specialized sigma24 family protein
MRAGSEKNDEPVSLWIRQLESGQSAAAQPLWEHFCKRLMQLAGQKLSSRLRRSYDEEDAALSAFNSLCRVISERRQADLNDRDNLWRLLVTITERKVSTRFRREIRDKRDFRRTVGESCFISSDEKSGGIASLPDREPTPEFAAEFADICGAMLDALGDETLKEVARQRLKNYDPDEIAKTLRLSRRTVERKLLIIRGRWEKLLSEEN